MDFLGIGLPELIVILLVALLVVGPQKLPQTAVQIARFIRQVRHYATEVTEQLREEMDKLESEYDAAQGELRRARAELEEARKEVDKLVAEATGLSDDELERIRQGEGRRLGRAGDEGIGEAAEVPAPSLRSEPALSEAKGQALPPGSPPQAGGGPGMEGRAEGPVGSGVTGGAEGPSGSGTTGEPPEGPEVTSSAKDAGEGAGP